ncbi:MAG: ATP-binding cassette domain-containing protein [Chloroflexi bacterium]|nr:ATP-binding cassette domain-containing protein [Chloroflexota bacterium]
MSDSPAIRLEGLAKSYGDVRALDGVDLEVQRGEIFGFVGPNGAGKTTGLRILMDLIRPTAGRAEVLGLDAQRDTIEVRRRCGYLPGDLALYDSLSVDACLDFVAALRGGVDRRYRDELTDRLRLDRTRRIGSLSRGNYQKVGLVAALMSKPDVLLLDEPTNALDPLVQEEGEAILREAANEGRTVFFSSHVLAEVEQLAGRVAMLRDGRIIAVNDLAEQRRLAPQRVAVTFEEAPPAAPFEQLPDVRLVSLEGRDAVFETHDGMHALIQALAEHRVRTLETHEITLEELFLSYYEGPERAE